MAESGFKFDCLPTCPQTVGMAVLDQAVRNGLGVGLRPMESLAALGMLLVLAGHNEPEWAAAIERHMMAAHNDPDEVDPEGQLAETIRLLTEAIPVTFTNAEQEL